MRKFYICETCGNLFGVIDDSGVIPTCCGSDMKELVPQEDDLIQEHHLPIIVCDKKPEHTNKECSEEALKHKIEECSEGIMERMHKEGTCDKTLHKHKACRVHIRVGHTKHPMSDMHHINWIILETDKGTYRKVVKGHDEPEACFYIGCDEHVCCIYAYCNMHGLWKTEVQRAT